jgi:predicted aspartyl protease
MPAIPRLICAVCLVLALLSAQPYTNAATALDGLLENRRYADLAAKLPQVSDLKLEQRDYFEGALALRRNRLEDAKTLLERAVNTRDPDLKDQERDTALSHQEVFNALMMLANLYMRMYHYGAAADAYNLINSTFGPHMEDAGESIRRRRHLNVVLKDVPPQTISAPEHFTLARTVEGYPIQIGDRTVRAIFDTGSTFSHISESTAAAWGVTALPGTPIRVEGFGGYVYQAHVGVIPELRIGPAILRHVVVVIAPDEQVTIAEIHAQVRPILGYPVAAALGKMTFSKNGALTVNSPEDAGTSKAPLWLGDASLLVSLETSLNGGPKLFMLDTGSASTFLTDKYLQEHQAAFPGAPSETARLAGAGGTHEIPAFVAHHLPLWFGATPCYLEGQHILTSSQGGEAESYYGLIGSDILGNFSSYTIDLNRMEFSVAP